MKRQFNKIAHHISFPLLWRGLGEASHISFPLLWRGLGEALALCFVLLLTSCGENDDTVEEYANWQKTNEAFFQAKYTAAKSAIANGSKEWKLIHTFAYPASASDKPEDYVVARVISSSGSTVSPLFSDSVKVDYRGYLIKSATSTNTDDAELGNIFDQSYYGEYNQATAAPSTLYCGGTVPGFVSALQQMHVGDRWKIYIPHQLGYGESTSSSGIPAYSTLVFDLTLRGIK